MTAGGVLDGQTCWARLREASHGVLSTLHPDRGVDAVPVVFAVVGPNLAVPVDRVKPKSTTDLQRVQNLRHDPRCVLLVHHYDDDWTKLWWVQVHAGAEVLNGDRTGSALEALAARYEAYRAPDAVAAVLLLQPTRVRGWEAAEQEG